MNKPEFIKVVTAKSELSNKDAEIVVNAVLDTIGEVLHNGDEVSFNGFGTFSVSNRAARTGVNPRTKEQITIPATKTPHFKSGKKLKDLVN